MSEETWKISVLVDDQWHLNIKEFGTHEGAIKWAAKDAVFLEIPFEDGSTRLFPTGQVQQYLVSETGFPTELPPDDPDDGEEAPILRLVV